MKNTILAVLLLSTAGPVMTRSCLFACLVFTTSLNAAALAGGARQIQSLDANWKFHLGDVPGAQDAAFADAAWRGLDVPHDWSLEGDYAAANPTGEKCAYLPSGIGWYRRLLDLPDAWKGRVVSLEFEGVYMNSTVWLNGARIGGWPYGYTTFTCDLTPHLKPGRTVLAVRVDNSQEPSARWYHGCGIYGHVRVLGTDPVHVPPGGVFVQTPAVSEASAAVRATVEMENASSAAAAVAVEVEILGPDGRSAGKIAAPSCVAAGAAGHGRGGGVDGV